MLHDVFASVEKALDNLQVADYEVCNWKHGELPNDVIQGHKEAIEAYQDSLIAAMEAITQALKDIWEEYRESRDGAEALLKQHEKWGIEAQQGFVVTGMDGKAKIVDADGNTILE